MQFEERKLWLSKLILFFMLVVALGLSTWSVYKKNKVEPICILTIKKAYVEPPNNLYYNFDFNYKDSMGTFRVDVIKITRSSGIEESASFVHFGAGRDYQSWTEGGSSSKSLDGVEITEYENYFQEPGTEEEEIFRISEYREIKLFRYRDSKEGLVEYILRVQPK